MSKSLDGKRIRIKGTDVETKVRYCTDTGNGLRVVTELWFHPEDSDINSVIKPFITKDNPFGDEYRLDQIELSRSDGSWYTPNFKVKS